MKGEGFMAKSKWRIVVILVMALFMLPVAFLHTAKAEIYENADTKWIDGGLFYKGDMNYPIWDTGTKRGKFLDVSSAYIKADYDNYYIIEVLSYEVDYGYAPDSEYLLQYRVDKANSLRSHYRTSGNWRPVGEDKMGWYMHSAMCSTIVKVGRRYW